MGLNPNFFLKVFGPSTSEVKGAGNMLLALNTLSMVFAALGNTYAIIKDKDTPASEKKFLVPAGLATGVANIGVYFGLTSKIIKSLEKTAKNSITDMQKNGIYGENVVKYTDKIISKAEGGLFKTGLFKKSDAAIKEMKEALLPNPELKNASSQVAKDALSKTTEFAKEAYNKSLISGSSVLGAFAGVVIGCGIITPIIRDVSAYFIQKYLEKKNPAMKEKPYKPYFDPSHWKLGQDMNYVHVPKQPLTLKNYMAFSSGTMKI